MRVPLLDLKAQNEKIGGEIVEALKKVVYAGTYVQGPEIDKIEQQVAHASGAEYGIAVSSGTDALLVSLMALGIGAGDEVITTPFSFFATLGVILRLGAKPVLVDIQEGSFNLNSHLLHEAWTPRTRAIIPVHLYGQCADMETILAFARKHDLAVVEDAAQAILAGHPVGSFKRERLPRAGSMGSLGCISFYPSKNLGAMGDAGMVVTQSSALAEKVRLLKNHGAEQRYIHTAVGGNFRMDGFQAAVLGVKLRYLNTWTQARRKIADQYGQWLSQLGVLEKSGIRLPEVSFRGQISGGEYDHVYHQYVLRVPDRDALKASLEKNQISTAVYYPIPFHKQPCWEALYGTQGSFPESEKASRECLALPMFPELPEAQQRFVVETIAQHYGVRP